MFGDFHGSLLQGCVLLLLVVLLCGTTAGVAECYALWNSARVPDM
jgi:hypothetical protein